MCGIWQSRTYSFWQWAVGRTCIIIAYAYVASRIKARAKTKQNKKKKNSTAHFTHSLPTVLFNISKCVWLPLLVFFFFFF